MQVLSMMKSAIEPLIKKCRKLRDQVSDSAARVPDWDAFKSELGPMYKSCQDAAMIIDDPNETTESEAKKLLDVAEKQFKSLTLKAAAITSVVKAMEGI